MSLNLAIAWMVSALKFVCGCVFHVHAVSLRAAFAAHASELPLHANPLGCKKGSGLALPSGAGGIYINGAGR